MGRMGVGASHKKLLLTTTMLVSALAGYGRRAYGACTPNPSPKFECSDDASVNTSTESISDDNATIITLPGFGIDTTAGSGGNALQITGGGAISFTDSNASPLAGTAAGLFIKSTGDFGLTPGSVTVNTNGAVTGGSIAIDARNYGSGSLSITASGNVGDATTTRMGIYAWNAYGAKALDIFTGAGKPVIGGYYGIRALSYGSEGLKITANGDVTGTNLTGIYAVNSYADLTVTVSGTGTMVSGGTYGIDAANFGDNLTITTDADTAVLGGKFGMYATNAGLGTTEVRISGSVTGTNVAGIRVQGQGGTAMAVTTYDGSSVSGATGLVALHAGSDPLTITVNGDVTGTAGDGIYASSIFSRMNITVGATGHVKGADDYFAIYATLGAASITVAGKVTGSTTALGGAIAFDQCLCADNRLELHPTAVITGLVVGGPGTDSFVLGGTGTASFDVGDIGAGQQYQGFETFEKQDASHWELGGFNGLIEDWTVNGGLLSVNATMAEWDFTVTDGTLGGTGIIGDLFVSSGGTVAPGNSIGTLTVNGSASLAAGSTFEVEVNAAGQSDLLVVNGTVSLTGAILSVLADPGSYAAATSYLIIDNDGVDPVTGTFGSVTTSLAFLTPSVSYTANTGNDVVLTMTRNAADFSSVGMTPNQKAVAGALDTLLAGDPLVQALTGQTTAGALQAFDALSGELHASVGGMLIDESHFLRDALFARLLQAFYGGGGAANVAALGASGPTLAALGSAPIMGLGMGNSRGKAAPALSSTGLAFWTQGFGSWGNFKSDGNAASADRTLGGFVSGVDAGLGDGWRLGFAGGYTQTSASVDARSSSADIESYHLAAYAGGGLGLLALRSGAAWTWHEIETSRAIIFPGFFQQADTSYDGDTGQIFGELALPLGAGSTAVETFGRLAYVHVSTGGFTESGGIAALTAPESHENVTYSMLGVRASTTMFVDGMHVTPHASAAWQHAFGDVTTDMALAFAGNGAGFVISGVPSARDSAFLEAGLDFKIAPDATLGVSYQGQLSDDVQDHGLTGRFDWRF